jgi:hypothetical protein
VKAFDSTSFGTKLYKELWMHQEEKKTSWDAHNDEWGMGQEGERRWQPGGNEEVETLGILREELLWQDFLV